MRVEASLYPQYTRLSQSAQTLRYSVRMTQLHGSLVGKEVVVALDLLLEDAKGIARHLSADLSALAARQAEEAAVLVKGAWR